MMLAECHQSLHSLQQMYWLSIGTLLNKSKAGRLIISNCAYTTELAHVNRGIIISKRHSPYQIDNHQLSKSPKCFLLDVVPIIKSHAVPECTFSESHHWEHVRSAERRSSPSQNEHGYPPWSHQLARGRYQSPWRGTHRLPGWVLIMYRQRWGEWRNMAGEAW